MFGKRTVSGRIYPSSYCKQCKAIYDKSRVKVRDPVKDRERDLRRLDKHRKDRASGSNTASYILMDSRGSDRKRGLTNDLNLAFVEEMISHPCTYCGETEMRMTLDRIDNTIGHTMKNVKTSCYRCNVTRKDMPFAAWLFVAEGMRSARKANAFGEWATKPFSKK